MKRILIIFIPIILVLILSSCGLISGKLTDEEFATSAQPLCEELKAGLSNIKKNHPPLFEGIQMRSTGYKQTADKMADLDISEESAPNAMLLVTSLADLAEANEFFADALEEAFVKADLIGKSAGIGYAIFGDRVTGWAGSILNMTTLDIEKELVQKLISSRDSVNTAAESLGLEACILE